MLLYSCCRAARIRAGFIGFCFPKAYSPLATIFANLNSEQLGVFKVQMKLEFSF